MEEAVWSLPLWSTSGGREENRKVTFSNRLWTGPARPGLSLPCHLMSFAVSLRLRTKIIVTHWADLLREFGILIFFVSAW